MDRNDWPVHRPAAPEAPIPGTHWYSGCGDPDDPGRVNPETGACDGCGELACCACGREGCPDHPPVAVGAAFPCPNCGMSEWKADYYEAVWQTCDLVMGSDGEVEFVEYTGVTGSYDDGSTEDESYRCSSCDHTIKLGAFKMLIGEAT